MILNSDSITIILALLYQHTAETEQNQETEKNSCRQRSVQMLSQIQLIVCLVFRKNTLICSIGEFDHVFL